MAITVTLWARSRLTSKHYTKLQKLSTRGVDKGIETPQEETYRKPKQKTPVRATLFDLGICNFHTTVIGIVKIKKSVAQLKAPMAIKLATRFPQVPLTVVS
jgi:hypothetical protein